ncbi:hypothetical protein OG21DRAFT_1500790 [Imleria badia]|nr:hypothetical protein OG21DRAFT_1500790 [Imleria badia]
MISVDQAFKGWHPGEQAVQGLMCLPERVSVAAIVNNLPDQHRIFHSTRLHYVPVTTLDDEGRPWASILCSSEGTPGFIHSPSNTALHINACLWPGDPISFTLSHLDGREDNLLASGLGLEPSTRRRNKFSGRVSDASFDGNDLTLELSVSHALGLCPKYIKVAKLEPYPNVAPRVVHDRRHMMQGTRLPDDVIQFIHQADTAYLATSYVARSEDADVHPSRVSTNHRGGRPGFVRVRPGDGRTLVLPNYNGNRMMNSLGNIFITPLAGIVFPSFSTGAVLYVTGKAETLFGEAARKLMSRVSAVTTLYVTGFSFVENALPIRETPDTVEDSPYCPPICYLSEEKPPEDPYQDIALSLLRTRVHNDTLATFTFEASRPVQIRASQNAVVDLSHFVRERAPKLVDWTPGNWAESDDCVRTWTVSVPPTPASPATFSLTIRPVTRGLITPVLHQLAHKVDPNREGKAMDVSSLGIVAQLRGVGGSLRVPEPLAACDGGRRLLWIAGGIGLTPFLGLTHHVVNLARRTYGMWDVVLVISSREPEVMLSLVHEAYQDVANLGVGDHDGDDRPPVDLTFSIHLFAEHAPTDLPRLPASVSVTMHRGRIDDDGTFFESVGACEREAHICGPLPFVLNAMKSLTAAGVDPESVLRERFTY